MKKVMSIMLALAALIFASSCEKEVNPYNLTNADTVVSVNVQIPEGFMTKANGLGTLIDVLHYEIYDEDFEVKVYKGKTNVTSGQSSFDFTLVRGGSYKFVFWAQATSCKAYNTDDLREIKINYNADAMYDSAVGNLENRDAFYAIDALTVSNSGNSLSVELKRPFAQVNFYTGDMTGTTGGDIQFNSYSITMNKLATVFDTVNGIGKTPADVTFESSSMVDEQDHSISGDYYKHLAMNYVLMTDNTGAIIDGSAIFNVTQAGVSYQVKHATLEFPVQSNYRTNIYGNLFTSNGKVNTSINPAFYGSHKDEF